MKVAAIICEYNPFHNGHNYQIQHTKEVLGVDFVIALMSGNYVQRGEPAILEKQVRTSMALSCGIDLVIELPLWYATSSAQYFARGSIALLNALGVVNYLSFGSEHSDLSTLKKLSHFLVQSKEQIDVLTSKGCKAGITYPLARKEAIWQLTSNKEYLEIIKKPNNILALEYLMALEETKSCIEPFLVHRTKGQYHDPILNSDFSSATAIRRAMMSNESLEVFSSSMPKSCKRLLEDNQYFPLFWNDFHEALNYKLITKPTYDCYFDVTSDLSDRIKSCYQPSLCVDDYIEACNNKSFTRSRISRSLLHILLNLSTSYIEELRNQNYQLYFQILGFRKEASCLIKEIKEHKSWPMVQHCFDSVDVLSKNAKACLSIEKQANEIYHMILASKYEKEVINRQIIV